MAQIDLLSWNVNGIRAVTSKGLFAPVIEGHRPDILCLQETKISQDQLVPQLTDHKGYKSYFSHAQKRGYSGVAVYSKMEPLSVTEGLGHAHLDTEGRTLVLDYGDFVLANIYFPNGAQNQERLDFKMEFYRAFLEWAQGLKLQGKHLVVCGDFNTAHKEIDLARPKANEKISGFLPIERAWMDDFVAAGHDDTFRLFNKDPDHYSWWAMRTNARERNVGWRIDYFFTAAPFTQRVKAAGILPEVMGSDHCPVSLRVEI
jgi:exodeoxyribonuclease III